MESSPSFLDDRDAFNFRKDRCVFTNHQFKTKLVHSSTRTESYTRGHYFDYEREVTTRKHLIEDLDLYIFTFDFDGGSRELFSKKKEEVQEWFKTYKSKQAKIIRKDLAKRFSRGLELSAEQQETAIGAIVGEYLKDLRPPGYRRGGGNEPYKKNIRRIFSLLELEDLKIIAGSGADLTNTTTHKEYYHPTGLKVQKEHWPFKTFEGEATLEMKFRELHTAIMENPVFRERGYEEIYGPLYAELLKHPLRKPKKDLGPFKGLEDFVLDLNVIVTAKEYNPAKYISA